MGQLRIGAGGWDYFFVPESDKLAAYSKVYDFVEVNNTYYRMPSSTAVSSWRRRVPPGFDFSVRCHRDLAEQYRLELIPETARIIDSMETTCKRLTASVLTILIPAYLDRDENLSIKLNALLSTISLGGTRVAVEFRGGEPGRDVLKTLEDNHAVQCVDVSNANPGFESNISYSRLFGKGRDNVYEFDDNELRGIAAMAAAPKFEKSILAFHGVRMYRDAGRLKSYLRTGKFPSLTQQIGFDSLGEVLNEDTVFPITKARLVDEQGWKLFDKTSEERVRAREVLQKLPEKTYMSLEDVRGSLKRSFT